MSAWPETGSSRTPRCQSAPFEEVEALTAATVSVRGSEPVECQNATVLAAKSFYLLVLILTKFQSWKLNAYDFICHIVPDPRIPVHTPLALSSHEPLQCRIGVTSCTGNPSRLHLGEMRLEKVDLVLAVNAGWVRS